MVILQIKRTSSIENGKKKFRNMYLKQPVKGLDWYIDYYVQGKRVREKIGPNKKLAELTLEKRKVEIAENRCLNIRGRSKVRFFTLVDQYIENYAKVNKRSYKDDIYRGKLLKNYFGNIYLSEFNPYLIEKFKSKRKSEVKESTINRAVSLLHGMFNKAIEWGYTEENPVSKVKMFKENNSILRYLTVDEMHRLIKSAPTERIRNVIIVALNTGMRKSEIMNLKWEDIDLNDNFIYIRNSKNKEGRQIPMNDTLIELFTNMEKTSKEHAFLNRKGDQYRDIRKPFQKALDNAGIKNFRFHDLRHTFASHMVMIGAEIITVSKLLGHKSIEMTMRYAHLSPEHKALAVRKLDAIMLQSSDYLVTTVNAGLKVVPQKALSIVGN